MRDNSPHTDVRTEQGPTTTLDGMVFPPCPAVLTELQKEIARDEPDLRRVSQLVQADVALSAGVLLNANSAAWGLSRKICSIEQALAVLGLKQITLLVTGTLLRQIDRFKGMNLARFWDVSTKRSVGLRHLARGLKLVDPDMAQAFGLFCDVGIPLLMQRFPGYMDTLKLANSSESESFTEIESRHHHADHAQIGSIMARTWGLPKELAQVIRQHHDYAMLERSETPCLVADLIAMNLVTELAIQRFNGMNAHQEWHKGGALATKVLMLSDDQVRDWIAQLCDGFAGTED